MHLPWLNQLTAPSTLFVFGRRCTTAWVASASPKAEVLTVMGKPIARLYAAGEVTGGTHGASRLGGCAIADGLVMGRIAADSCVANAPVEL